MSKLSHCYNHTSEYGYCTPLGVRGCIATGLLSLTLLPACGALLPLPQWHRGQTHLVSLCGCLTLQLDQTHVLQLCG